MMGMGQDGRKQSCVDCWPLLAGTATYKLHFWFWFLVLVAKMLYAAREYAGCVADAIACFCLLLAADADSDADADASLVTCRYVSDAEQRRGEEGGT